MMWTVEAQEWNNETMVYIWWSGGLTGVPSDIPAQAVEVDLWRNQIEVIRQNSFSHLTVCKTLVLSSNKVHTIESGAWNGLNHPRELNLHGNELEVLRPGMWISLDNCTELRLSYNKIHTIQRGTFQDGLRSLKALYLSGNEIEEITQGMFLGLTKCTRLFLNGNKIYTIHSGALNALESLRELWLHNNELSTLSWTIFGKDHPFQLELGLSNPGYTSQPDNPLVCNTSLCWITQGEQQGWIRWWIGKPECSNTKTDWDDITLDCSHLGLYK